MIIFEHVTKRYPGGTVAVDDLSLEVPGGKIMVLVGPSGGDQRVPPSRLNGSLKPAGQTRCDILERYKAREKAGGRRGKTRKGGRRWRKGARADSN